MREVLEYIFADPWHFVGVLVMLVIITMWHPVEVNILNGRIEQKNDDE